MKCPKCGSVKYYFDGAFIQCKDCGYKEVVINKNWDSENHCVKGGGDYEYRGISN